MSKNSKPSLRYSYEQRQVAIRYYLSHGHNLAETVKALGYPSIGRLNAWILAEAPEAKPEKPRQYTLEERRIAVQYYLEHGKCLSHTIKALGYPSRGNLRSWILQDAPTERPQSSAQKYTVEQRQTAVEYCLAHDNDIAETVRSLGYPSQARLRCWLTQANPGVKLKPSLGYKKAKRKAAVQYYLEHGMSIKHTLKALGYPSETTLRIWVDEDVPELNLRKKRAQYSDEEQRAAVQYYLEHGKSISQTIKALGYPTRARLIRWLAEYAPEIKVTHQQRRKYKEVLSQHKHDYTEEERKSAVRYYLEHGKGLQETVNVLGYPTRETLSHWLAKYAPETKPRPQSGYSIEEREAAVQYYLEHGGVSRTIKALGYPGNTKLLRGWIAKYAPEVEATPCEGRRYTSEERQTAVQYYLEHGKSFRRTVQALGYPKESTLSLWVLEYAPQAKGESRYSVEERKAAVQYYREHGNLRETLGALGYPCNISMLRSWVAEYAPDIKFRKPYTKGERDIAVQYFLRHGQSLKRTIEALGYPSRNQLKAWVYEAVPGAKPLGRTKYTAQQREVAIRYFLAHDHSLCLTVQALGYPSRTVLRRWISEDAPGSLSTSKPYVRYTSDQRNIAVDTCLENGKCVRRTTEEIGYPSNSQLYLWLLEDAHDFKGYFRVSSPFTGQNQESQGITSVDSGCVRLPSSDSCSIPKVRLNKKSVPESKEPQEALIRTSAHNTSQILQKVSSTTSLPQNLEGEKFMHEKTTRPETNGHDAPKEKRRIRVNTPQGTQRQCDAATANTTEPEPEVDLKVITLQAEVASLTQTLRDLKNDISRLQMEKEALELASQILKKDQGVSLDNLSNREKVTVIDALRHKYMLKDLLSIFNMSKSSYCYQEKAINGPDKYADVRETIKDIFHTAYDSYGYRRIHAELKMRGKTLSEKVIQRIMREENLVVHFPRQRKFNAYQGEITPAPPNRVKRNFHADEPNKIWLTDITEFSLPAGKYYLASIIDCFDGLPVAWAGHISPNADLANTTLLKAISTLKDWEHPIVHSDRGSHYRWPGWIQIMRQAGLIRSMSKKGCSPDNSACEGHFGHIKNEMFYDRSWKDISLEEFANILDTYLHWFAEKRIKMSLGGMSPMQYRRKLGLIN